MFEKLFEIQKILLDQFKQQGFYYPRSLFDRITLDNRITGIVGARGVGKTTFLLKQVLTENQSTARALYVTADNLFFFRTSFAGHRRYSLQRNRDPFTLYR